MGLRETGEPTHAWFARPRWARGRAVLFGVCLLLGTSLVVAAEPAREAAWLAESRTAATAFANRLRSRLQAGLQQGPVAAIEVCHEEAPKIAAEVGAQYGLRVRRSSIRVRNINNAPDTMDLTILSQLESRLIAGEPVTQIEFIENRGNAGTVLAKPLVTEAVCLLCHGQVLAPEVSAAIRMRYPDDAATGFKLGELRGALIVERRP